ncbi:MAG TPA: DUF3302 domain-containing protein [Stenotrophomonas sp.]|nr:DUF3302 domain-containing protein [Stenotrophomonas sp.]
MASLLATPSLAHASLLSGETLDTAADVVAWVALIIVPIALITAFWLVHILPEKIAEKRRHPQLAAIKTLCLLSLLFGGLLWPLAWLWAYTKPVLHKLAYGTDQDDHAPHGEALTPLRDAEGKAPPADTPVAAPATTSGAAHASTWQQQIEALNRRLTAMEIDASLDRASTPPLRGPTSSDRG